MIAADTESVVAEAVAYSPEIDMVAAILAVGDEAAVDHMDVDSIDLDVDSRGKGGAAVTEAVVDGDMCDTLAAAANEGA